MRSPSESAFAPKADPTAYVASGLHDTARDWPQTNCYADLWIEAIHARGLKPEAMLAFTATLDFEGDQFTFFKPPLEDIEALYGFSVRELSIYDDLADHLAEQCARGRLVLIEVDAFHLPDTRGVSYGIESSKTTIGVNRIDPADRVIDYFHNEAYFRAEGTDYDGILAFGADAGRLKLPPYAEILKADFAPLGEEAARDCARALLARHIARRPARNPVAAFATRLPALVERMSTREPEFFHKFAFNSLRQLGANFELMGSHLAWLDDADEFVAEIEACRAISSGAKAFQFLLARAIVRRKTVGLEAPLAVLSETYDRLFDGLTRRDRALRLAS
ncbi:MAG: DUF1839 family protein [Methylobacteriaceae bacterium]|nr:DUF1839 family protein [Methylobacteriaceae bacterium]